jgi:Holliday junction resolvasome RuvABC endonuclease subunit
MWTALAADPGPTRSGVAVVSFDGRRFELRHGAHLRFGGGVIAAGVHEPIAGLADVEFLLDDLVEAGGVFAVEELVGWAYEAKRVQALVETGRIEGRFILAAIARGLVPRLVPAKDWRGALCRSETASDEQVRVMVEGLIPDVPHFRCEERPHIYDAAGLAIVALCREAGVQIPRTPELEQALVLQQAADKSARAAKRAKKAAGELAPEQRGMTRGQRARRRAGAKQGWATRRST